jgi:hypothetical protein
LMWRFYYPKGYTFRPGSLINANICLHLQTYQENKHIYIFIEKNYDNISEREDKLRFECCGETY